MLRRGDTSRCEARIKTAGLGLCRNRHGNQSHMRIQIPKDLASMLGRAEVRLLGAEVRRYAIASARLVHSRKITAFDEMSAVMDSKNTSPTPEQQAEARQRLLDRIQQLATPDPDEAAEDVRYAQEANEQHHQNAQLLALDGLAEEVRVSEFLHAKRLHEIMDSADPGLDAFKFTTTQQSAAAEVVRLRAGLAHAERGVQAKEHELTNAKGMLHDALKRGRQPEELLELRISELLAAYQDAPEFDKNAERTCNQYVAEVGRFIRAMGICSSRTYQEKPCGPYSR